MLAAAGNVCQATRPYETGAAVFYRPPSKKRDFPPFFRGGEEATELVVEKT